ncbi:22366_t:CDS:2 [Cetraspora pellucida]|uniref:22366_t:CDS:1 n=1 Tax=Cetraspora pellucida TaxID=1433469 RepID=A0A9N9AEC7_9GLOM|nr:22366_t:CDS:2 [Cetraspora pellucida]
MSKPSLPNTPLRQRIRYGHTAYSNGNSQINEKTKTWFSGRTKANTKYNKNFQNKGEKNNNVGNYDGDCSEELCTSFN